MILGKVLFWKQTAKSGNLFGWGMLVDGNGNKIYFNERTARYSPVRQGDVVEFELFESPTNGHEGLAAFKVEKIDVNEDETPETRPQEDRSRSNPRSCGKAEREHITTIPGADNP
jgi:hypothetical protein